MYILGALYETPLPKTHDKPNKELHWKVPQTRRPPTVASPDVRTNEPNSCREADAAEALIITNCEVPCS